MAAATTARICARSAGPAPRAARADRRWWCGSDGSWRRSRRPGRRAGRLRAGPECAAHALDVQALRRRAAARRGRAGRGRSGRGPRGCAGGHARARASARSSASAAWPASEAATSRSNSVNSGATRRRAGRRGSPHPRLGRQRHRHGGPERARRQRLGLGSRVQHLDELRALRRRHRRTSVSPAGRPDPRTSAAAAPAARSTTRSVVGRLAPWVSTTATRSAPARSSTVVGDELQRVDLVVGQQLVGDLGGRGRPLLAPGALLEEPGVRDGHARRRGQRLDEHLVLRAERVRPAGRPGRGGRRSRREPRAGPPGSC